ncbi:phytoene desaturase family protein [Saccharibacillus sp. CPCC 101409]|uniref:phytoene desaturase family protein n=1 Tax=Saccharibacillus sp. CPCC 101409 TaxID=3058041 RepID=UPI0026741644|nr:phytoene desaturase family protein [Saccharibacillus sp. CPCC 101409]MDO3412140.1 phytoene desaturase family protein [Saccharibacillus sp. CPCC 101409]
MSRAPRSPRVAIVGGGIGGLTAALLLSRRGAEVTLLESRDRLGGRIAFERNESDTRRIDQGPTIVLLPEMLLSILEEGGIERERIKLIESDPLYRIHYSDGRTMTKRRDPGEQAKEIERLFPGQSEPFLRYMKEVRSLYPGAQKAVLERTFPRKRDFFTPRQVRMLGRLQAHRSVRAAAARYFKHEDLIDAYSLQSLYIGGEPSGTPGVYSILPYAEHDFGIWMIEGGYARLPVILEEELRSRGVDIRLNTRVERLPVEDGRCRGIVADGVKEDFDAVLFNGDFPHLLPLLEGRPEAVRRKPYRPSSGCVLVYIGASKRWEDTAAHQFFLPDSLTESLQAIFKRGMIPANPSFYVFNPVVLDGNAAPEGESVLYFLIPAPDASRIPWSKEGRRLARKVLRAAEQRGFPGLRESLKWIKLRTPEDARQDGNYEGGSFGIAPILAQSGPYRPQPRPFKSIDGLYAAGASVHPGGGVPIVMQGARMAVNQLMEEWNP